MRTQLAQRDRESHQRLSGSSRVSTAKFVLWLVACMSLIAQGVTLKSHVHAFSAGVQVSRDVGIAQVSLASGEVQKPASENPVAPKPHDEDNCQLCQAQLSAGAHNFTLLVGLVPPTLPTSLVERSTTQSVRQSQLAHTWQSRAPPKA